MARPPFSLVLGVGSPGKLLAANVIAEPLAKIYYDH